MAFAGVWPAYSAMVGGLVNMLAGYLPARKLFKSGTLEPNRFLRSLYVSEAVKFVIAALLSAGVVVFLHVDPLFVLLAFIVTVPAYWVAVLLSAHD